MSAIALIREADLNPRRVKKRKLTPPRADGLKHREAAMLDLDVANGRVGLIYFASNPESKTIKIGFTTNLDRRMRELRGASGADVYAYAGFHAPRSLEHLVHRKLKIYRVRNEWFNHSDELQELIGCMEDYEIWHGLMTGDFNPMFGSDATGRVLSTWSDSK